MDLGALVSNIGVLVVLLMLSGFFSGSETALSSLTKLDLERLRRDKKSKTSKTILGFTDNPRRLFNTILLGNTFINTAFATITASLVAIVAGGAHSPIGLIVGTLVITVLLLMFGEITPKSIAVRFAEPFARVTSRPLWLFSVLVAPIRVVLRAIMSVLLPLFGARPDAQSALVTAEDVRAVVRSEDALPQAERRMLSAILELHDIQAREVMVPRTDVTAVPVIATITEALTTAARMGFSRLPVYRKSMDDIVGIFQVKDLSFWRGEDRDSQTLEQFLERRDDGGARSGTLVRSPFFAFEGKKVSELLTELGRARTKMAVLYDEYGGVAGIVTVEDILEEVVGDIIDEHDVPTEEPRITPVAERPGYFEVPARTSVRAVNSALHLRLDEGAADTVGGYALGLFQRLPTPGEHVTDRDGTRFEVAAMGRNQITTLLIEVTPPKESS